MSNTQDDGPSVGTFVVLTLLTLAGIAAFVYGGVQVFAHQSYGVNLFWLIVGLVVAVGAVLRFTYLVERNPVGYQ